MHLNLEKNGSLNVGLITGCFLSAKAQKRLQIGVETQREVVKEEKRQVLIALLSKPFEVP